jgi:hypothetical protein
MCLPYNENSQHMNTKEMQLYTEKCFTWYANLQSEDIKL